MADVETREVVTQEHIDRMGDRFVTHNIGKRCRIWFEHYLADPERYDNIIAFMEKSDRNKRLLKRKKAIKRREGLACVS